MKNYLAFDLGASSGRAIIGHYDGNSIQLEELHRFANGPYTVGKELFWDINTLFAEIKEGLRKALAKGENIDGIGIDTWGVDVCYLGSDGKLIGLPHHYRDQRTDDVMPWTFQRISKDDIYSETGIQFMTLNTIFQLSASIRDNEAALQQADKLLFMPNALTYLLCGKVAAEYSIATTSQLFNPNTGDWSWKIIDALGLKRSLFPQITPSCTIAGTLTEEIQKEFNCGPIPVILIGSHDTASAVAAVPAVNETGWAYLSSGTWSLMGVELPKPLATKEAQAANYTNEGGVGNTIRFLKNIMGLWIIQECRNQWIREGNKYSFAELTTMAREEAQPFYAIINPNDKLFEAPGDMPSRIKSFCHETGQMIPETPAQIIRVALESLALRYRQTWNELEALTNQKLSTLHLVGGGCQNGLLNEFTANAIQATVITGPVEATAFGNILGQGIATGTIADLNTAREIVKRSEATQIYKPTDADIWTEAYKRYETICQNGISIG
ncbi:MAG: rhamnulokinase [Lentisphaeria bacterium]|nr:rhamnulokinase [Lentisphaeria bacterium]